jgi:hypothetical protein
MTDKLPAHTSQRVAEFLAKQSSSRSRLIFALDATMSRQPTWDTACKLQGQMFSTAGALGTLQIQLVYFRGQNECRASRWTNNAYELSRTMTSISCQAGETQIGKILAHIKKENVAQKVNAAIFVGDAMEEVSSELHDAAAALGVPLFLFQEGTDPFVETTFREMALLSNGAFCRFEPGAENKLAELLRAVVAFAAGGIKALRSQNTEGARKLLGQMEPKS